jgi:hypothetical protein
LSFEGFSKIATCRGWRHFVAVETHTPVMLYLKTEVNEPLSVESASKPVDFKP